MVLYFTYRIVDIWAGTYVSFAKTSSGEVYAWGLNNYYQLGTGDMENKYFPCLSSLAADKDWTCVSAGQHHSVAVNKAGNRLIFSLYINISISFIFCASYNMSDLTSLFNETPYTRVEYVDNFPYSYFFVIIQSDQQSMYVFWRYIKRKKVIIIKSHTCTTKFSLSLWRQFVTIFIKLNTIKVLLLMSVLCQYDGFLLDPSQIQDIATDR